jgi:hypothetical protein
MLLFPENLYKWASMIFSQMSNMQELQYSGLQYHSDSA